MLMQGGGGGGALMAAYFGIFLLLIFTAHQAWSEKVKKKLKHSSERVKNLFPSWEKTPKTGQARKAQQAVTLGWRAWTTS